MGRGHSDAGYGFAVSPSRAVSLRCRLQWLPAAPWPLGPVAEVTARGWSVRLFTTEEERAMASYRCEQIEDM